MIWGCENCKRRFKFWPAINSHCDALGHTAIVFGCRVCKNGYASEEARREHEKEAHNRCADCNRVFESGNNLRMHLNSRVHRSTNIKCPFCKTGFVSATGLAHHLESGRCSAAPSLNRDTVYAAVRSRDPAGALTKKLIGWHGSPTYEANEKAWNGKSWECYLCHKGFKSLGALNRHLGSPAHQQALYHCPNRLPCGRDFKTLAAVMNHLESESCGFSRFEAVQNTVTNVISGDRRLTFG